MRRHAAIQYPGCTNEEQSAKISMANAMIWHRALNKAHLSGTESCETATAVQTRLNNQQALAARQRCRNTHDQGQMLPGPIGRHLWLTATEEACSPKGFSIHHLCSTITKIRTNVQAQHNLPVKEYLCSAFPYVQQDNLILNARSSRQQLH